MNTKEKLENYKKNLHRELLLYFKEKRNIQEVKSEEIAIFIDYLEEFTLRGGKRLRGAIFYYTYKYFFPLKNKTVFHLSMFIELIQAFLIIHDDIMDSSDIRRGGKTYHKIYEEIAKKQKFKKPDLFGASMGILAGDLAHIFASDVIASSKFEDSDKIKMYQIVSQLISETVYGQIKDIMLAEQDNFTEEDVIEVHRLKTAKYTFTTPAIAAATLAGASKTDIKVLNEYCTNAGIAYQIRDDILGMYGEDEKTGKSANSDIQEGKKTLLIHKALEGSTKEQKKLILKYLGKSDLNNKEANIIREIVRETGSLDYSIKMCEDYVNKAKKHLKKLPNQTHSGWQFLNGIADYIIVRDV